jgi:fatty-acyl-CoA synthase
VFFIDPSLVSNPDEFRAECPQLKVMELSDSGTHPGTIPYRGIVPGCVPELLDENDLISINYTSGTTGYLKGVMYTHRGAYLNAIGNAVEIGLTGATRYLWTLPMFHCHGWCYTWTVTAVGGTHVCLPKPLPAEVFRLVQAENITHLCAAPTVLIDLAQFAASNRIKLESPLTIMTGGAAPTPQVIHDIEAVGARVIHLYGLTETYGPSTICQWQSKWDAETVEQRALLKARQGVADLMVEQRVVRPDMTDVNADGEEIGELVIRGNALMKGYYRDPEATEKAFEGGWFHTRDLAVLHPDGYVEIKDRAKHIIISGGEKISTLEVERAISSHPAVLEVAVVPSPHDRWGEVPKAFVVLKPQTQIPADELYSHCRERLAAFKCPRRIEFVNDLPKTSTGKIQKYILKEMEWKRANSGTV